MNTVDIEGRQARPELLTTGQLQAESCEDIPFVILFYVQVVVVFLIGLAQGTEALKFSSEIDGPGYSTEYIPLVFCTFIQAAFGLAISGVICFVFMTSPGMLIHIALLCVVCMSVAWVLVGFVTGSFGMAILGLMFCTIFLAYASK